MKRLSPKNRINTGEIFPLTNLGFIRNIRKFKIADYFPEKCNGFMPYILLFLILNISGAGIKGQDFAQKSVKYVFITGIACDGKTLESLAGTNIRINNHNSCISDGSGRFSFYGAPGDTIIFTYMGYQPTALIVPDTLRSKEYVTGVFMQEKPIDLAEIIILPRVSSASVIINPVQTDQKTMDIAQIHVDKAVVQALTRSSQVYDAGMHAKKMSRTSQMRNENRGMLATPENSVGLSTQSYRTNNMIYGSPISTPGKIARERITSGESKILTEIYTALDHAIPRVAEKRDSVQAR